MKLRLIAGGFESFTGQMGVINFVDGVSVDDVLPVDAIRVAGVIGAEWEDGTAANVSQMYLDNMNTEAAVEPVRQPEPAAPVVSVSATGYTEEELSAIASEKGIAGLREIADPLELKGNSIRGLIDAILAAAPVKE